MNLRDAGGPRAGVSATLDGEDAGDRRDDQRRTRDSGLREQPRLGGQALRPGAGLREVPELRVREVTIRTVRIQPAERRAVEVRQRGGDQAPAEALLRTRANAPAP